METEIMILKGGFEKDKVTGSVIVSKAPRELSQALLVGYLRIAEFSVFTHLNICNHTDTFYFRHRTLYMRKCAYRFNTGNVLNITCANYMSSLAKIYVTSL